MPYKVITEATGKVTHVLAYIPSNYSYEGGDLGNLVLEKATVATITGLDPKYIFSRKFHQLNTVQLEDNKSYSAVDIGVHPLQKIEIIEKYAGMKAKRTYLFINENMQLTEMSLQSMKNMMTDAEKFKVGAATEDNFNKGKYSFEGFKAYAFGAVQDSLVKETELPKNLASEKPKKYSFQTPGEEPIPLNVSDSYKYKTSNPSKVFAKNEQEVWVELMYDLFRNSKIKSVIDFYDFCIDIIKAGIDVPKEMKDKYHLKWPVVTNKNNKKEVNNKENEPMRLIQFDDHHETKIKKENDEK